MTTSGRPGNGSSRSPGNVFALPEVEFIELLERELGGQAADVWEFDAGLPARLYLHLRCLAQWRGFTSLVGPGAANELIERHYAESLRGVEFCAQARCVFDLGSGGGFPGLVLAAALPKCSVHLFESKQRKAAFLRQAALRMNLPGVRVHCMRIEDLVGARFDEPSLPKLRSVDCVTLRALRLTPPMFRALAPFLATTAHIVHWGRAESLDPQLPLAACKSPTESPVVRRGPTVYRVTNVAGAKELSQRPPSAQ